MAQLSALRKRAHRTVRYHWMLERVQYELRRNPLLTLPIAGQPRLELRPDDIIVDCGANVGDITSRFARTGARVYAFEPNPMCFALLTRRFRAMPTVKCFNEGVMDKDCELTLSTPEAHGQWDSVETTVAASLVHGALNEHAYGVRRDTVRCIDLARFIREVGPVRLLKLDIEGAEIPVINHLLDTHAIDLVDLTVVETHEKQIPHLAAVTGELRARIAREGLAAKINLDWN